MKKEPKLSDFKGKDLTDFIKLQLMKYFRFDKQYTFVCSECINYSDINALNEDNLIEVEIKISKNDFLNEFNGESSNKTLKHRVLGGDLSPSKYYLIPNLYYFCTTPALAPFIEKYLRDNNYKNYGLLVCNEKRNFNKQSHITCVKKPRKIHNKKPSKNVWNIISKRVQSEMINLKEKILTKNLDF